MLEEQQHFVYVGGRDNEFLRVRRRQNSISKGPDSKELFKNEMLKFFVDKWRTQSYISMTESFAASLKRGQALELSQDMTAFL